MTASISDVATQAGVSVATVSRALRGLPNVAPSTRDRVLDAARDLDYVADPNASRLAAGRTRSVGMVVPLFTQWFFSQCVAGAEGVLAAGGYETLLYNIGSHESRRRFLTELPFRKRVDGIVLVDLPVSEAEMATLCEAGVPIVTIGLRTEQAPSITIDNYGAACTATRHLVNLGHERIGMISNLPDDPRHFHAPVDRRRGYQDVLAEHDLELRPELDVPGNFSLEGGAEAMAQLVAVDRPPTAVFAQSDEMAIGALKTIHDAGLRVPEDISILGFDDHDMAEFVGLTTIAQPVVQHGELAAELLLERADRPDAEPTHVEAPTKLIVRDTTAPRHPARRDGPHRPRRARPLAGPPRGLP
ncbi:LacI family transcriptional regulator [Egibacter rhizosphaerae]|uniref:LacI family transcriptional regulator n=2 Tax=Egibacter rhizosphaerae TaxID=1670831 RepID=A0A411YLJ4_9ACTN|nr:LacI family transcriptional regulator [Egibacter rhizosphaerae]